MSKNIPLFVSLINQTNKKTMETMISQKALKVILTLKSATNKSVTGVSFVSIRNYTNKFGEVSNNLINVGANYEKAKQKDITFLENINFSDYEFKSDLSLLDEARKVLIASFIKPDENRSNGQINAYTHIVSGVKVHNETGVLYIYGHRENKQILTNGEYPIVKSKPLTIAKDELRKLLRTGKFTQYALEIGNEVRANGETLEL
jgi:hypothetical protein